MFNYNCDHEVGAEQLPEEVCVLSNGELVANFCVDGYVYGFNCPGATTNSGTTTNPLDQVGWDDLYAAWGLPIVGKDLELADWCPSQPLIIEILGYNGEVIETRYA